MREKLIKLLKRTEYQFTMSHSLTVENVADDLIQQGVTIATDNNVGKWIPVKERMPEESGAYLVATERGGVFITHYSKRGQRFSISRMGSDVTHWQERPMPPKGED